MRFAGEALEWCARAFSLQRGQERIIAKAKVIGDEAGKRALFGWWIMNCWIQLQHSNRLALGQ